MNPLYLLESLERMEQGIFDLISEVKSRYDFTPIDSGEALEILFNIQSSITTAKQLTGDLINVLNSLEAEYEIMNIMEAEPIKNDDMQGFVRWRKPHGLSQR